MITDFEEQTQPLDLNEKKCMEIIARGLSKPERLGKDNAITNKEMCQKMNQAISLLRRPWTSHEQTSFSRGVRFA